MVVRPWHLSYGATDEEARRPLPGDDLMAAPSVVSTRAVTIDAAPRDVWPWLVQMGQDRGGLYSYTWIENLFGLDIHNADRIVPAWQDLAVGDTVRLSQKRFALVVRHLQPQRSLVFEFADGGWVWSFHLEPAGDGSTRLLVRNRWTSLWSGPGWQVTFWALEPSAFIMEQRMLRGIASRAEAGTGTQASAVTAPHA